MPRFDHEESSGANAIIPQENILPSLPDNGMTERLRNLAASAIVSVEANPFINDGGRIAATTAIFASTQDPRFTTLAFAGMTAGVELAGAWGASHLLDSGRGQSFMEKTHRILEKARISRFVSGVFPDAVTTMVLGTSVMLAANQAKDPSRTKHENLRYGTVMALGATAVSSAQVFGLSSSINEGLHHPSPAAAGLGVLCLAAMAKGADIFKKRLNIDSKTELGADLYRATFDAHSDGPQTEGISSEEILEAAADKRSLFITNKSSNAHIPVLVPVKYNGEYNSHYFDTHFPDTDVYHYSDVFKRFDEQEIDPKSATRAVAKALKKLAKQGAMVVTDDMGENSELKPGIEALLEERGIEFEKTYFVDPRNNEPAAVIHYSGDGKLRPALRFEEFVPATSHKEAFQRLQQQKPEKYEDKFGTVLIEPDEITDELFEDLWAMYSPQFEELIKENPSMQAQTKDDLRNTLKSEGSLLVASFENGKPICVAYFVTDISKVYWLRKEFYEKQFPEKTIWYFPGIAVDSEYEGLARSMSVIGLATEIANECGLEPTITFQCTNVSKDYVPKIAQFSIQHTGHYKIAFEPIAKYSYVGYRLGSAGKTV